MPPESVGNADQSESPIDQPNRPARRFTRPGNGPRGAAPKGGGAPGGLAGRGPLSKERLALRALPRSATLRDVVKAVLGERPVGHAHTYANVMLTQRALARLAQLMAGHPFAPWEPAPWPGERSEARDAPADPERPDDKPQEV
jgi:hypothetical protein